MAFCVTDPNVYCLAQKAFCEHLVVLYFLVLNNINVGIATLIRWRHKIVSRLSPAVTC